MKAIFPDLENKIVLVTGATRGIGRTIALSLAAQKAHVVFNHRNNQEAAMSLAADIEKAGGKATALNFDITDYAKVQTELDQFMKDHGFNHWTCEQCRKIKRPTFVTCKRNRY